MLSYQPGNAFPCLRNKKKGNGENDMATRKLGIVIYGVCNDRDGFWEDWLDRAKELIFMIGYTPTHTGMTGTSFPEKLRTLQRSERKMRTVIANKEPVRALSVSSLPKNYHTELDSYCYLDLRVKTWGYYEKYSNYAYCEMNFDECNRELVEKIKSMLLEFIEMEQCEIFAMDKEQVPYNYVFKGMGDDISKYRTLEILSRTDKK